MNGKHHRGWVRGGVRGGMRSILAAGAITAVLAANGSVGATPGEPDASTRTSTTPMPALQRGQRVDTTGSTGSKLLSVSRVTPWVTEGTTWEAQLRPDASVSPGAVVTTVVHASITGTDQSVSDRLDEQLQGSELGTALASLPPRRVLELLQPDGTLRIAIDVAGDPASPTAISVERPGVYPVSISLTSDTGAPIESMVLHLVIADSDPAEATRLRALLLLRADGGDAYANDGPVDLTAARSMAQRALTILEDKPTAGITTVVRAETLEALAASQLAEDRTLLEQVVAVLRGTRALKAPWARTHTDGWVTEGGVSEIRRSLIAAQDTYTALASQILDPRVWVPDDTVGNASLTPLNRLGVDQFLLDETRLDETRLPRGERGYSRPIRVGAGTSSQPAMVADPAIAAELSSDIEPPLAAHRALTRMAAQSLSLTGQRPTSPRAVLVVLDERVSTEAASAFVDALTSSAESPIRITPPESLFTEVRPLTRNADGTGSTIVRNLRAVASRPDLGNTIAALPGAWSRAEATRRMRPVNDPVIGSLRVDLLGVTRRGATEKQRRRGLERANGVNDATLSAINAPARRTVTVTARESSIPLRLENAADVALRVRIAFESPRLEFAGGEERDLVLEPGTNRFDMPVSVRSSGVFVLRVRVTSPNAADPRPNSADRYALTSSTITVRSTAFSGVGLILSGGALIVLVIWWGRTLRRQQPGPDETLPPSEALDH